jgi:hypothetical protein
MALGKREPNLVWDDLTLSHKEKGVRRTIWIPEDLNAVLEQARMKLGLGQSAFYRYCALRLLEVVALTADLDEARKMRASVIKEGGASSP